MNFKEAKQRKERGMSVEEVLELELEKASETESVLVITKSTNGVVNFHYSSEGILENLGLLSIGEAMVIEEMTS